MSRKSLIKSAMKTTSKKKEVKSVLAKMSSTDSNSRANPEGKAGYRIPYQEDTNKSPYKRGRRNNGKVRYKMWNKKAGRFEYGTR